jgi:hypothetical protein
MTKARLQKTKRGIARWRKAHADPDAVRAAYQARVLDWVVQSMAFENEPVSMERLKELLEQEKAEAPAR